MNTSGLFYTCNSLFQHKLQTVQIFHLERFIQNKPIEILQIYEWLLLFTFFAAQNQTAEKFSFWATNFWNGVLFQPCPTYRSSSFWCSWFKFGNFGAFSCTDFKWKGIWNLLLKPRIPDLLSAVFSPGEISLCSLQGYLLRFFVWKLVFLKLNEQVLIPPCLSYLEVKFGCCCEGFPFFWNKMYLPL